MFNATFVSQLVGVKYPSSDGGIEPYGVENGTLRPVEDMCRIGIATPRFEPPDTAVILWGSGRNPSNGCLFAYSHQG
ncbi:hypothetical protein FALBO_16872, partial [Fusarium albosuccineum]